MLSSADTSDVLRPAGGCFTLHAHTYWYLCVCRQDGTLDLLGNELEPLLPSSNAPQCNGAAGSSRGAEGQARLRVRSRLFSTSEDGPLGASRQILATSPTNPFDTAEVLGSDSIPSSPFGDSTADDWLHVQDALLDRYGFKHL